jgi:hypothetical protein
LQLYPAASNYAEKLTGISGLQSGTTLYFVNPWVTNTILVSTRNIDGGPATTQMYIYVILINTGKTAYKPTSGSIDLTWYGQNHLDGTLLAVYYKGTSYAAASAPSITPGSNYYAIYKMNTMKLDLWPPANSASIMFWGDASITDGTGSNSEDQTYFSGTVLLSGLWIRSSC